MKWIKYDGYHETHQYVDESVRIVGEVHGSQFEKSKGWTAFNETTVPATNLGRYVELAQAQKAVERCIAGKAKGRGEG